MTRSELIEAMARAIVGSETQIRRAADALAALESAIPGLSGVVKGTHVVVPREPTRDMLSAFVDADIDFETADARYRAMLAAHEKNPRS